MILFHYIILKCTVASKFLLLQESTRDPTPLVFVCDTPCGVVRHMDCRNPEITKELWGNFAGCFEKPSFEKLPDQVNAICYIDCIYIIQSIYIFVLQKRLNYLQSSVINLNLKKRVL